MAKKDCTEAIMDASMQTNPAEQNKTKTQTAGGKPNGQNQKSAANDGNNNSSNSRKTMDYVKNSNNGGKKATDIIIGNGSRSVAIIPPLGPETSHVVSEPMLSVRDVGGGGEALTLGHALVPPLEPAASHLGVFTARSMEDMLHPKHKLADLGTPRKPPKVKKKASSLENLHKLPPLERSASDETNPKRHPGHRFKSSLANGGLPLSPRGPILTPRGPVLSPEADDTHTMLRKFEKFAYRAPIHDDLPPAPAANSHSRNPVREKTFMATKRRKQKLEPLNIVNTMKSCVEYFEHHGQIYVSPKDRQWSMDCLCGECSQQRQRWMEMDRLNTLAKQRTRKHQKWRTPYTHARRRTTVAELEEEEEGGARGNDRKK